MWRRHKTHKAVAIKNFLANNNWTSAIPTNAVNWWWFLFNILLQSCHHTHTYKHKHIPYNLCDTKHKQTITNETQQPYECAFPSFWKMTVQCHSKPHRKPRIINKTVAVSMLALCWSFDFFYLLFTWLYIIFVVAIHHKTKCKRFLLSCFLSWMI